MRATVRYLRAVERPHFGAEVTFEILLDDADERGPVLLTGHARSPVSLEEAIRQSCRETFETYVVDDQIERLVVALLEVLVEGFDVGAADPRDPAREVADAFRRAFLLAEEHGCRLVAADLAADCEIVKLGTGRRAVPVFPPTTPDP